MAKVQLDEDNFIKQIVQHGYFAEQFPKCFNSDSLAEKISIVMPVVSCGKRQASYSTANKTSPTTLSTFKNDISRRLLSLPNPKSFLRVVKLMSENWHAIKNASSSNNSLSPITYLHKYGEDDIEALNSENVRESKHSRSDLVEGIKNCIRISLGYKYRLKVDIANCYNSIYTHSIAWAMCGKDEAKNMLLRNIPETDLYKLADCLDAFIRFQKNNETNGIVVGPYTSRIFSEIILADIDKRLKEKRYNFKRYVDDYKFYFRTEYQAQESIPRIENLFGDYNLSINTGKTKIDRYPFEVMSSMKKAYLEAYEKEGVFGVLNIAADFHNKGEDGAYKYALKFIKNTSVPREDQELVVSLLTNIMLINPKYGKIIVPYIKHFITDRDIEGLSKVYNQELLSSLDNDFDEETLLFIHIIKELRLFVNAESLTKILCSNNDFAIIIALDIWKNRRTHVKRTKKEASDINSCIKKLGHSLVGEKYNGSRWLLLHEIRMHKLINTNIFISPVDDDFFNILASNKISFYLGIK